MSVPVLYLARKQTLMSAAKRLSIIPAFKAFEQRFTARRTSALDASVALDFWFSKQFRAVSWQARTRKLVMAGCWSVFRRESESSG
jgi:hypothetical protein